MFGNPFRLRSTLSASARANENDIQNAKRVFGSLGYLGPHARQSSNQSDDTLFGGIKRFQSDHGLTADVVMKPGGETERMIGKLLEKKRNNEAKSTSSLVATPEPNTKPSLLDPFPSRTPGIIPETGKRRVSSDMRRTGKLTQDIKGLLELIVNKAKDNEVIAESARTVKAALKASDQTSLAKFHATAVKDLGDGALAEIAEFGNQLNRANPEVFNSWLHIFRNERPEDAERMRLADKLSGNSLKISEGNESLSTEERADLNEEAVGTPPRKPGATNQADTKNQDNNTTLATDLADHPEFKGIDLEFVYGNEGDELMTGLYIPKNEKTDEALGKSGATVGHGVDLGQMDSTELQRLGDQHDLPQGLIDKLKPYTGKTREEAKAFLETNPLTISEEEARQLSTAKYIDTMFKLRTNVNKHLGDHSEYNNLPASVKTVVYDLAINYGPNFLDKHHRFRGHLQNGNVNGMIAELRNYGGPSELRKRRNKEADILEELLNIW